MRPLGRLGLIGDVHCQVERVRAALRLFTAARVEAVVAVGDLVDGPGDATRTLELLDDAGVICVAGNHDRWLLGEEMRDTADGTVLHEVSDLGAAFLRGLPRTRELETVAGPALLCHGLGEDDMAAVKPDHRPEDLAQNEPLQALLRAGRHRFVLNGHTHRRMVRRVGSLTIVNGGTLLPGDEPCCAVVDFEREHVHFHRLDDPDHPVPAERLELDAWAEVY